MEILSAIGVTLVVVGLTSFCHCHDYDDHDHPSSFGLVRPLMPVSVITGHSGLLTLGLTGAALLNFKAAAAITYWLSIRKHRRAQKGWGWNERKRQRSSFGESVRRVSKPQISSDFELSRFDPSLDDVLQFDQLGCGMRLVCELSAKPHQSLKDDEKRILELFGRDGTVRHAEKASRGKLSYNYAARLGSHSEDSKICSNVYRSCPHAAPQIMSSLRDIGT